MFKTIKAWYFKTFLPFEDPGHPMYCSNTAADEKSSFIEWCVGFEGLTEEEAEDEWNEMNQDKYGWF